MWVDKKTYWAWEGSMFANCAPPTEKKLHYAHIKDSAGVEFKLAVFVSEGNKVLEINRKLLDWLVGAGFSVVVPEVE